jgi:LPS-assembly protein
VIRRSALALAIAAATLRAPAAAPFMPEAASNLTQPVLTAPSYETDLSTGNIDAHGDGANVQVKWQNGPKLLLTADELHYVRRTNVVTARGRVTMTDGEDRILADAIEFHRNTGTFFATNIRLGRYPIYIRGATAEGKPDEITIHNAVVSYTDPGRWKPSTKAKTIVYSPGHYLRTVRSMVGLNGVEFVPLGALRENLNQAFATSLLTLELGFYSNLGGIVDVGAHVPVFPGIRLGGDATLYTKRGIMVGPTGAYADPDGSGDWFGSLQSGVIRDHGVQVPDLLTGDPIPSWRGYAEWQHQQQFGENLSLTVDLNWWSDPDVIRDFRYHDFKATQTPEDFVELVDAGDNTLASVFARARFNSFEDVQQQLPEVRFDLLPTAIGAGLVERFSTSGDVLREQPPDGGPILASDRLDAFYGLSRPIIPNDWFSITPVAGARLTDYFNTEGAATNGSYLRALGEVGFDSEMRASGTFEYTNPTWGIDGLRQLITPQLSYRYLPEGGVGQQYIPAIQRNTFTTYLTPIELGDMTAIDQLQALNTLRLGVDNLLQTRDGGYGSRNLIDLNVADDLNFLRTQAEPDFSDLHSELLFTPAHWIEVDLAQIVSLQTLTLREFDAGLTLRDADAWSLQVASNFLRHEDDYYILNYQVRLNEKYQGIIRLGYNARAFRFDERGIGMIQNLANTWRVQYLFTVNDGPTRLGKFGFRVDVDVVRY